MLKFTKNSTEHALKTVPFLLIYKYVGRKEENKNKKSKITPGVKRCASKSCTTPPTKHEQPSLSSYILFMQVRTEVSLLWHRCVVTLYCPRSSCRWNKKKKKSEVVTADVNSHKLVFLVGGFLEKNPHTQHRAAV